MQGFVQGAQKKYVLINIKINGKLVKKQKNFGKRVKSATEKCTKYERFIVYIVLSAGHACGVTGKSLSVRRENEDDR